ncbi:MAG: bacterial Ig-like domain-containing protein, partial [Oscillospiraceae bacterium]|nr:bacterial Ig-like domain-containing protein [Oscillospiraceae bacterium]
NMLYLNQGTADAQGRLLVNFVLKENVSDTDIFVVPMGNNGGSVSLNTGASSNPTDPSIPSNPSVPSIPSQSNGNGSTVSRTLERIEVTKTPYKTIYAINEDKLDVSGGKITLYYSDNSKNIIPMTSKMVSGFDNTKSGKQTLTVTYNGKTAQFDVEVGETEDVSAASGIEIDTSIIDFSHNNAGWICFIVIITAAGVMFIKRRQNK